MKEPFDIKDELQRIDKYRNSINELQYTWPKSYALSPLLNMLATIGYILCDILEAMSEEISEGVEQE